MTENFEWPIGQKFSSCERFDSWFSR